MFLDMPVMIYFSESATSVLLPIYFQYMNGKLRHAFISKTDQKREVFSIALSSYR